MSDKKYGNPKNNFKLIFVDQTIVNRAREDEKLNINIENIYDFKLLKDIKIQDNSIDFIAVILNPIKKWQTLTIIDLIDDYETKI
jgi:hypothetical protein